MRSRFKEILATVVIVSILFTLVIQNHKEAYGISGEGEVDLYTKKEPFCGRGFNASSDAFAPGEEVIVYASVTFGGNPVSQIAVTFKIEGPKNSVENITFWRSVSTNSTGIAVIAFRLPYLKETTFGIWIVTGYAKIGDKYYEDMLAFEVGWIVENNSISCLMNNDIFTSF